MLSRLDRNDRELWDGTPKACELPGNIMPPLCRLGKGPAQSARGHVRARCGSGHVFGALAQHPRGWLVPCFRGATAGCMIVADVWRKHGTRRSGVWTYLETKPFQLLVGDLARVGI